MLEKWTWTHLKKVSLKSVWHTLIYFLYMYAAFKQKNYLLDRLNLKGLSVYFCVFWPVSHAVLLV